MALRFLVRGVIYEMRALLQPVSAGKLRADAEARDWSNLLHTNVSPSSGDEAGLQVVSAADVIAGLGVKGVIPGVEERVEVRKKQVEQNQALEELIGGRDGLRAKYVQRLREKKLAADFRREHGRFGPEMDFSSPSQSTSSTHHLVPGSGALVRYLQERGVLQALATNGAEQDLRSLLNQLNNFEFQEIINAPDSLSDTAVLNSICSKWGFPSKQVLVVVAGSCSENDLRRIASCGFFVCRVKSSEKEDSFKNPEIPGGRGQKSNGLISWLKQKLAGDQEQGGDKEPQIIQQQPQFKVSDMTELKWIIEDLNGVSYKSSSLMTSGFR